MASYAEQLAANLNLETFSKATELKQRLLFTLIALVVYRLGTYIPLPGVDPHILAQNFHQKGGGVLDMFNMFSGGALQRMTIFALNIMPYMTASIVMMMMSYALPSLEALRKEGESGRKRINQYTRYLTVVVAAVQGYGIAVGLEAMGRGSAAGSAVMDPGFVFRITTVITLVGGSLFLMWLGEQITARGISGNSGGTSIILFAGIVANLPRAVVQVLDLASTGAISSFMIVLITLAVAGLMAFIVFMERAQRRITIQYPKRQKGNKMFGGETTFMPLKLNTTGVLAPVFAGSLIGLPVTVLNFSGMQQTGLLGQIMSHLNMHDPFYLVLYAALIVFFTYTTSSMTFNPVETADNLRKSGAFIPGIKPGKNTSDYLDYVLKRILVIGTTYLVLVCLVPQFMLSKFSLPFYLGGTSLLIVVTVPLDTLAQVHSYLIAHQYEARFKKARLRGRER